MRKMKKIGLIGAGNMGGALALAMRRACADAQILLSDASREKAQALADRIGAVVADNETVARESELLFFAVKPNGLPGMIDGIRDILAARDDCTVVSMAAGVRMETLRSYLKSDCPLIRMMPNTPVSVGEGMILWCADDHVSEQAKQDFRTALSCAGALDELPEALIDAGCALSGCGPAFVYLFLEALADGGVECGLPREKAMRYAAQTVLGAATLAAQGSHPGVLKDAVCSPGGSTIAGVHALEKNAFRAAAMDAVIAAYEKTKELGRS